MKMKKKKEQNKKFYPRKKLNRPLPLKIIEK